jgi:hypothetical protein
MSEVELKVSLEEAVAIVNLIGSLPTAQGAYPLFQKNEYGNQLVCHRDGLLPERGRQHGCCV